MTSLAVASVERRASPLFVRRRSSSRNQKWAWFLPGAVFASIFSTPTKPLWGEIIFEWGFIVAQIVRARSPRSAASVSAVTQSQCLNDMKRFHASAVLSLGLILLLGYGQTSAEAKILTVRVTVDLSRGPLAEFLPDEAFGAALDGHAKDEVERIYTAENVKKMRSAGLRKVAYRLRTELGIEAWHWNEQGAWSDAQHRQGYWTSSDRPDQQVLISHGYRLSRRGNTLDQAANDGFSRLTDGDDSTFWKSNPYLDEHYTGEANDQRPQWVVVDLGEPRPVNFVSIHWGLPYATHFEIQYGTNIYHPEVPSTDPDWNVTNVGRWESFPEGSIYGGSDEPVPLRLSGPPVQARYIRILLYESSGKGAPDSTDIRDSLGFAIREIFLGVMDDTGAFHDEITHAADNKAQTVVYTSSTDPWHRAIDIDPNTEQPGFDLVFRSGLTNGLPVLLPVPLLYDTPENAAAEIRFLKARGYAFRQVEMGEEPEGQQVSPEHEAALYLEFATAIHKVDPTLVLGGPSFQSGIVRMRFEGEGNDSWVARFIGYLRDRGRLGDYRFLSFEWYPFDDLCQHPSEHLIRQPKLLADVFRRFQEQGVPSNIPWLISEYGFSAYAGRSMVEIPSALLNADIVGQFLMLGGQAAYLYGYEPSKPFNERRSCAGYGQMMLFEADGRGQAHWPMPIYFAARLLTHEWAQQVNQRHRLYSAVSSISDIRADKGVPWVTAYAVERPDGKFSVMLVNKDPERAYSVHVSFVGSKSVEHFIGKVAMLQYSQEQYVWKEAGTDGYPIRTKPPRQITLRDGSPMNLPPFSLTIVRGFASRSSQVHRWPRRMGGLPAFTPGDQGLSLYVRVAVGSSKGATRGKPRFVQQRSAEHSRVCSAVGTAEKSTATHPKSSPVNFFRSISPSPKANQLLDTSLDTPSLSH
jgi:hypothetical protein